MSIGDYIQFTSTGCRGLVVKITQHNSTEYVHVHLDVFGGKILAFPRTVIESGTRIL